MKTTLRLFSVVLICVAASVASPTVASAAVDPIGSVSQTGNRVTVTVGNGEENVRCAANAKQGFDDRAYAAVENVPPYGAATLTFELAVAGEYAVAWECYRDATYAAGTGTVTIAQDLPRVSVFGPFEFSTGSAELFASSVPTARLTQVGPDVTWRAIAGDAEVNCRSRIFEDATLLTQTQTYVVPAHVAVNLTMVVPEDGDYTTDWTCFTETATWGNESSRVPISVPGNVSPQFGSS
ncbi:MAG: hypothetical protein U5O16_13840 [Rhodococcus sp. (in: high G+C Gram-positive bacteria)]|uniref:hypothetical protein n=1 Tax=Rhodococcus sp. TaxID=1831 RepID=UPI002AD8155B|nr:hypothetical protein [Rhodococcus sp. (in: high G+C Gram-positive bacteria)]